MFVLTCRIPLGILALAWPFIGTVLVFRRHKNLRPLLFFNAALSLTFLQIIITIIALYLPMISTYYWHLQPIPIKAIPSYDSFSFIEEPKKHRSGNSSSRSAQAHGNPASLSAQPTRCAGFFRGLRRYCSRRLAQAHRARRPRAGSLLDTARDKQGLHRPGARGGKMLVIDRLAGGHRCALRSGREDRDGAGSILTTRSMTGCESAPRSGLLGRKVSGSTTWPFWLRVV